MKSYSRQVSCSSRRKQKTPKDCSSAVTWRVATPADMAALRVIHFDAEVTSGQAVDLADRLFEAGDVLAAELDGKIIGGLLLEEAIIGTFLGLDRRIAESAGQHLIAKLLSVARDDGKRSVQIRFPRNVTLNLDTEVDDKNIAGRNIQ